MTAVMAIEVKPLTPEPKARIIRPRRTLRMLRARRKIDNMPKIATAVIRVTTTLASLWVDYLVRVNACRAQLLSRLYLIRWG